jgi:3-oxoacyl-[acyl-carrier-protein] synthase II
MVMDRRVVITGMGLVTPLGNDVAKSWGAAIAGHSAVGPIARFDASALPTRIAAEVRGFDPIPYFGAKEAKKVDRFCQFAVAAADEAIAQAHLLTAGYEPSRIGAIVGVGMGGIDAIEATMATFLEGGVKKVSPFFIPRLIANMAPGQIAIRHGLTGVNYSTTSACASGGHAIGEAFRLIRFGLQDAMVAGGAEAGVTPLTLAGFAAMRALSSRNDDPQRASRPFDRDRDGFVVGEGAGVVILESLDRALARGATIFAEIAGYGANADAHHITSPAPDGRGAAACMALALADAGEAPEAVDYINAHGTATEYNDSNETTAIKAVFGPHVRRLAVSSTKSMMGHALGASGGIEAVFATLAVADGVLPPTINLDNPDPLCDLDYVAHYARARPVRLALSNSFGFGGANACLAFRRCEAAPGRAA